MEVVVLHPKSQNSQLVTETLGVARQASMPAPPSAAGDEQHEEGVWPEDAQVVVALALLLHFHHDLAAKYVGRAEVYWPRTSMMSWPMPPSTVRSSPPEGRRLRTKGRPLGAITCVNTVRWSSPLPPRIVAVRLGTRPWPKGERFAAERAWSTCRRRARDR